MGHLCDIFIKQPMKMNVGIQLRKLVKFKILSLTKRTVVSQGGVKNGNIISPFLSCATGLNKNEFIRIGTSSLLCDANVSPLSGNVTNSCIKDGILRSSIVEPGFVTTLNVGLPFTDLVTRDSTLPGMRNWEMIDPSTNVVEKKARKSLIRIRKRKMRIHKRKKLRKKMRYIFAKIKQRRRAKKEKEFLKLINNILEEANNYDPEKELVENIEILKWERPVTRVKGFLAPKPVVEEYLREKQYRDVIKERVEECLKKMKA